MASLSRHFPPKALRRHQNKTVRDSSTSYKIDNIQLKERMDVVKERSAPTSTQSYATILFTKKNVTEKNVAISIFQTLIEGWKKHLSQLQKTIRSFLSFSTHKRAKHKEPTLAKGLILLFSRNPRTRNHQRRRTK